MTTSNPRRQWLSQVEKEQEYCPYCSALVLVTKTGRLWPHGPRDARCKGSREYVR